MFLIEGVNYVAKDYCRVVVIPVVTKRNGRRLMSGRQRRERRQGGHALVLWGQSCKGLCGDSGEVLRRIERRMDETLRFNGFAADNQPLVGNGMN